MCGFPFPLVEGEAPAPTGGPSRILIGPRLVGATGRGAGGAGGAGATGVVEAAGGGGSAAEGGSNVKCTYSRDGALSKVSEIGCGST